MNKLAVVTGGTNGNLGPIISDELRKMGYVVHSYDLPNDVRDEESISDFNAKMPGTPSVIVNNAAIDNPPTGAGGYWNDYEGIIDVNLLGAVRIVREFLPYMVKEGGGVVINIGSIMGNVAADWRNYPEGFRKPVAYGLSKAALIQFSRSLTMEYGRQGIRSVCMAFGPVDTGKFTEPFKSNILRNLPLGRFVSEQSVRASIRYAVECPELAGQQVLCDAGYTCV
jgi:NAD(P)-dependent dehydrogenase (short-subunit alcohol dehydrogenase family)